MVVPLVVDVDVVVLDIAVVEVVAVFILLSTGNAGRTKTLKKEWVFEILSRNVTRCHDGVSEMCHILITSQIFISFLV